MEIHYIFERIHLILDKSVSEVKGMVFGKAILPTFLILAEFKLRSVSYRH
jgi:hypothetical protein